MSLMTVLFWTLVTLIAYGYAGYPVVVAAAGLILDRRVRRKPITPSVTVVIAAYNEADSIADRIRNLFAADYPAHLLGVVVASDGSSDDTVTLASGFDSTRVQVLDLPRRGKAMALADAVSSATGDILVFSDANTAFRPDAISMLVRNFADPDVGGVAGHTRYVVAEEAEAAGVGENLYWRYDTWLKILESRTGSVVSAHGGMYAIRRELFRPVENLAVTDDFAISTAVVDQGKRLVFESDAVGFESTMTESASEFRRRVRLMTRGLSGVLLRRRLLDPFEHGFYSVALMSRKLLRRLLPFTFPPLLLISVALAPGSLFFTAVATAQVGFIGLGGVGWGLRRSRLGRMAPFYVPFFFILANVASMAAVLNVLRGNRIERWTPHRHENSAPRRAPTAGAVPGGRS